jgi:hypothetical protein
LPTLLSGIAMGDVAGKLAPAVSGVDMIAVPLEGGVYAVMLSFLGAKIRIEAPITITKKMPSETAMSSSFFFSIRINNAPE